MSTPTFGGSADAVLSAQQQVEQRRQQQQENSARLAVNMFTYVTVGVGDLIPVQPIEFDCVFLREPSFSFGPALVKAPDTTKFRLPMVQPGVLRWITKDLLGSASSKSLTTTARSQPGAVYSDQARDKERPGLVETGDPNQQLGYIGAYMYFVVNVDLKPGMDAVPPNDMVIHHHLVFQEMAIKRIDSAVQKPLAADNEVTALSSPLTTGLASN